MTPEVFEYEIRRLREVVAATVGDESVTVLVYPTADADAVRVLVAAMLATAGLELPVQILGGMASAATRPRRVVPVAVGAFGGIGVLASMAVAAAFTGVLPLPPLPGLHSAGPENQQVAAPASRSARRSSGRVIVPGKQPPWAASAGALPIPASLPAAMPSFGVATSHVEPRDQPAAAAAPSAPAVSASPTAPPGSLAPPAHLVVKPAKPAKPLVKPTPTDLVAPTPVVAPLVTPPDAGPTPIVLVAVRPAPVPAPVPLPVPVVDPVSPAVVEPSAPVIDDGPCDGDEADEADEHGNNGNHGNHGEGNNGNHGEGNNGNHSNGNNGNHGNHGNNGHGGGQS